MKKLPLLLSAFFGAFLISTSVVADPQPAASGPRPGTVEAMQCLFGIGKEPAECLKMFAGSAQRRAASMIAVNAPAHFEPGHQVFITYWGRADLSNQFDASNSMMREPTKEMDIFDVKLAPHQEYTFLILPADDEGKIRALRILPYAPHDPLQVKNCSDGHLCTISLLGRADRWHKSPQP